MRKRYFLPLLPGALTLLVLAGAALAGPANRTKAVFALERQWTLRWPWQRGSALPDRLEASFAPLVPVWMRVEPHISMLLDPHDLVSYTILRTGAWEPESWQAISEHLHPGDTFIDVGAHIGYYSLKAAAVLGSAGRVLAVEPNPQPIAKLEANIAASGWTGVISVQPVACSDAEGTLDLFAAPEANTGESSFSAANASQFGRYAASYRVRTRPLDAIVRDAALSRVDAIKVDVEGAEYLVLKGAQETLRRYHPVLIVELVDRQLQAMGSSVAAVTELLRSCGYVPAHSYEQNVEFVPAPAATIAAAPRR